MNDYRRDARQIEREFYWTLPRIILAVIVTSALLGSTVWLVNVLSQPARVISYPEAAIYGAIAAISMFVHFATEWRRP